MNKTLGCPRKPFIGAESRTYAGRTGPRNVTAYVSEATCCDVDTFGVRRAYTSTRRVPRIRPVTPSDNASELKIKNKYKLFNNLRKFISSSYELRFRRSLYPREGETTLYNFRLDSVC